METLFLGKQIKKTNIAPLKRLGQNFLMDKPAIRKIINSAGLQGSDAVLEIGPGMGALTKIIAEKARRVIAVEKDSRMIEILKEKLKDYKNVEIVRGDILKITNYKLQITNKIPNDQTPNFKIVANLPFYITSPVIRKFLENDNPPKKMTLVVQKELAQRICAKPPKMSILAVSVQIYSKPKIVDYIPKTAFWPKPKVDAAILEIAGIERRFEKDFMMLFFRIVKAGFSHPRKQIGNNLADSLVLPSQKDVKLNKEKIIAWLAANKIQASRRAETLSISDWINLAKTFPIVA